MKLRPLPQPPSAGTTSPDSNDESAKDRKVPDGQRREARDSVRSHLDGQPHDDGNQVKRGRRP